MSMHWRKYKLLDAERLKGQGLLMAEEVVKCVTATKTEQQSLNILMHQSNRSKPKPALVL